MNHQRPAGPPRLIDGTTLGRDVVRALVRCLLVAIGLAPFALAAGEWRLTLVSLLPLPLSLIEVRRARRPPGRRWTLTLLLWGVSYLGVVWLVFQESYVRDLGRATTALDQLIDAATIPAFWLTTGLLSACFVATSMPRVPETQRPIRASLQLIALSIPPLGVLLLLDGSFFFGGCFLLGAPLLPVLALGHAYSMGDWIERKIWSSRHRKQAAALQVRRDDGDLTAEQIWLGAYLGDEAARFLSGPSAPEPSRDLLGWVRGLERAGLPAVTRAAYALARLAHPHWDEAHAGDGRARALLDRLTECLEDPCPRTRTAAKQAVDDFGGAKDWELKVMIGCASALTADGDSALSTATTEFARSAARIARHLGEAAVRVAVTDALLPWSKGSSD